jgi:two-component system, cell cycle sensor histidine kinase and response regulator CckA
VRLEEELSQRRLTEQALRESERRFRSLADTAPVGIWVTDPDGSARFYNKRVLSFAGRSMDQLVGNRWIELVHPDDLDSFCYVHDSAVAARRGFRIERRMLRADGQYRWVLNTGVPRFLDRVYVGHIGTVIDTTDLKQSHEQIIETKKPESLDVLAAGIAHDFNNMLGAIFAESDVALLEIAPQSPGRDNVERIKAVAVRASEIVKLLMAYAGAGNEAMEAIDLSRIVAETIDILQGTIPESADLHVDLAKDLPSVQANAAQIRLVALNLLVNSVEALKGKHGHIAVITERIWAGADGLKGLPKSEYLRLKVSDTGCGMTSEVQALAFDPFYTTKSLGRGLGLAVVQGIVRSHRGWINLMSKPDAGSTFEVLLPCALPTSKKPGLPRLALELWIDSRAALMAEH